MILAGDIGGTNTRLALFDDDLTPHGPPAKFPTGDGSGFEAHAQGVLAAYGKPVDRACIAVAGPVVEGVCRATNFGRSFVETDVAKAIGIRVTLINDLVANATGIERLPADQIVTLIAGEKLTGSMAVCSPGTGLGEGLLMFDGKLHRAYPAEGGHSRFAPTTADERGLLDYLAGKFGDVIAEHVLCGRGIGRIFDYYVSAGRTPAASVVAALDGVKSESRGNVISKAALAGECDVCRATMALFVNAFAIECASLACKTFAIGGVYVGGGIPPKIRPLLEGEAFHTAFVTHPTMHDFLKRVPVRLILNDDAALEGAALYGLRFG